MNVALDTTLAALAAWLLIVPLPFRTPSQAVRDVKVWAGGMLFTYNAKGIAQRPFRSYSYKNQSIMALAHRFLRDVPADGEAVLPPVVGRFEQYGLAANPPLPVEAVRWAMAEARPTTLAALGEIHGVGAKKLATYGEAFLNVLGKN